MSNFLVDSTIWIEFFKGNNKAVIDFVLPLIDKDKIYFNGIILSELLIGANNEKEFALIKNNFSGFKLLETHNTIFEKASEIGFRLRRAGITIPLTDLIIAAHCIHHDLTIITSDPHFKLVNKQIKLKLKFLK